MRALLPVITLFWSGDRRRLAAGIALAVVTAMAGIALLGLSGWFITATAIAGATVATALAFDVFMPSAGIRLFALGRTAARYGERLATHDATLRMIAQLRERLFRSWAIAPAAGQPAANPSRLLFRLTLDIDALDSLYLRVIVPALAALGSALGVAVALAFVDPLLGLVTGLALIVFGLGMPVIGSRMAGPASRRRAYALEAVRARAIDLVRGQADLATSGRLGAQLRAIATADQRLCEADTTLNRIETGTGLGLSILGTVLLCAVILVSAHLAEANLIGAPVATLAVLLVLGAMEPFGLLRRGAVEVGRTLLAARRLGARLREPASGTRAVTGALDGPVVRIVAADIGYPGAGMPLFSRLSLHIEAGERVALIGSSGAGKSTLLASMANEITPSSGRIQVGSTCLLTQRTELFRDTLRGNLALARPDATQAQMLEALSSAGLSPFLASLSAGLETPLGEGGAGLSAGQARRLALARLLLRDAPVWLLDEPTESLDAVTASDVLARLRDRAGDRTLVIATHSRREAALADRILVLREGCVTADLARGTPAFDKALSQLRPD